MSSAPPILKHSGLPWPFVQPANFTDARDVSTWPTTPNLNLVQPPDGVVGWGDDVNTNWSILDTAAATQADWNATSGIAFIKNKPAIVSQVNSDWLATGGVAAILNKPLLSPSATIDTTNAANITSGVLALARVPVIPTTQISGILPLAQIPVIPTTQISGVLPLTQIPVIPTTQISGILPLAQIPTIPTTQISGVLPLAQIPTIPYTQVSGLATVAHSGSYPDLLNLPVLPANTGATANQFLTAYNSATGAFTKAQPSAANITGLATVAISGSYPDLINPPVLAANTGATANQFFTAYNSATGAFTKAQPTAANISGLAPSATTDTTIASNITSGVLALAQLPTIPTTKLSGLAPSATTDTTNATNITSGTLPHAQLPALVAADIPTTLNATNFVANMGLTAPTAATSGANQSSPTESIQGNYWTGSASAADSWSLKDNLGAGANPTSTLAITHTGSTGVALVTLPNLSVTGGTAAAIGAPTFAGTGVNDMTVGGVANSVLTQTLKVQIVAAGTPDTFQWSMDLGVTWQGPLNITGASQNLSYIGMTITFAATTGHIAGDTWTVVATPSSSNINFVNAIYLNGVVFMGQTGNNNLFIGTQTLGTYPSGNKVSGYYNTAIGVRALSQLTSGLGNIAVGAQVMMVATTASSNVGVGGYLNGAPLSALTTGSQNTVVGTTAVKALTTGTANTIIGYGAGTTFVTDSNNTIVGASAFANATAGANNTMVGFQAGGNIPSTTGSIFIGYYAGYYQTANNIFTLNGTKQTTLAQEQTYNLLYGQFATGAGVLTNQFLTVNGKLGINTITPKAPLCVPGLAVYANNAAAVTGGLGPGDFYRNGADPDVVMVVH